MENLNAVFIEQGIIDRYLERGEMFAPLLAVKRSLARLRESSNYRTSLVHNIGIDINSIFKPITFKNLGSDCSLA